MEKKIGYVLSGGGARGFAHLGILQYLEELNITPYAIAGTSAGAIAATLYAAGKSPRQILQLMKEHNLFSRSSLLWRKPGFFSMDVLAKLLTDNIEENSFEALRTKLFVAVTDLNLGESLIFSEGELFQRVIASASIPVIFEPVMAGDRMLVDGGVLNNFPVEPVREICDLTIGCHVNKMNSGTGNPGSFQTYNILERSFHLAIANTVYSKVHLCDVFIDVPLQSFRMYDTKKADAIFEAGYNAAVNHKDALQNFLPDALR